MAIDGDGAVGSMTPIIINDAIDAVPDCGRTLESKRADVAGSGAGETFVRCSMGSLCRGTLREHNGHLWLAMDRVDGHCFKFLHAFG